MQPEERTLSSAFVEAAFILDALPIGITVQDHTGNLVFSNSAGAALLGFSSGREASGATPAEIVARFEFSTEEGGPLAVTDLPGRRALRGEEPGEVVLRVRDVLTGEESWRAATATPIRDERGEVLFAVNVFRDITREKQSEQRLAAQYEVSRVLGETTAIEEAAPRILEAICRALRWDAGLLWWVDRSHGVLRWREGWSTGGPEVELFMERSRGVTFGPDMVLPGRLWTAGRPDWIRDVREDPDFVRVTEASQAGIRGACGFPVLQGGEVVGVMEFFSQEVRTPDPELLRTLGTFGAEIGLLVDRQEAEQNQRYLIDVGDALARSLDSGETLQSVARSTVPRLADICLVYLLDGETGVIDRVAMEGAIPSALLEDLNTLHSIDPEAAEGVPKVIRTGRPELHSNADATLLATDVRDPERLRRALEPLGIRSWMCLPLTARGGTFGAISFVSSVSGRRFDERTLTLAQDVVRRAAFQVDNSILYGEGEDAQRRLAFLAEASRLLSGSLDYARTLKRIADLAVPHLADWCVVDMLEEDGSLRHVAVAHTDPTKVEVAQELRRRYPPDPDAPGGIFEVIRTGEPALYREVPDELLEETAVDEEHLRLLRDLQMRSAMIVPLVARGRTLGTLSLVWAESERTYGERELAMATDLAARAAVAVDNARLYRFRSHIARTLQRSLLPPVLPVIEGVELTARYRPAEEGADIGGDFYDIIQLGEREWGLVIGDVCGKGVEAAALTGLARHSIRATLRQGSDGQAAITVLNEEIRRQSTHPDFCTLAFAHLRQEDGRVDATVVCAGHPQPLIVRATGEVERAGAPGTLLGVIPDIDLQPRSLSLGPGDALFLYTDGLVEGMAGDESAEALLRGFLAECAGADVETMAAAIDRAVSERTEAARDDSAFLVARVVPPSA